MITNGFWYIGLALGTYFGIAWLATICGAYIAWLYTPWACEKLLIIPISIWLCKVLFRNHPQTQEQFAIMLAQAKSDWESIKSRFRRKRNNGLEITKRNNKQK